MLAVRVRRIGHELLSIIFRKLRFCQVLSTPTRRPEGSPTPSFDSSHPLPTAKAANAYALAACRLVRVRRIELPTTAWKAVVLPLNYTRKFVLEIKTQSQNLIPTILPPLT